MRKWMLLCAVVVAAGFLADRAPAQEPAKIAPSVITTSEPVMVAPRAGLFSRMRERRGMTTMVSQPVIQTQAGVPMTSGVQQAQALEPQIGSKVQQAQGTEIIAMPATQMQVMETRQGLLPRLRARLGRY
jgi:hypothetical protein